MSSAVRKNFIFPQKTEQMLDALVPKGKQSAFVAKAVEESLNSKRSWGILETEALLDIKNPIRHSAKIRKELDKR